MLNIVTMGEINAYSCEGERPARSMNHWGVLSTMGRVVLSVDDLPGYLCISV
jgi:hypothetical protein